MVKLHLHVSSVQKESYSGGDHIHLVTFSIAQTCTISVLKREKKKKREREKGKERYGPFSSPALGNLFDYQIQVLPQQCLMS
jgi:hypothetical protein